MIMRLLAMLTALALAVPVWASAERQQSSIIAIGDLHGDFEAWRAIATAAGLIDRNGRWTGGSATLVQAGDVVDRGPNSLKIIEDLMRLQRQARRAGGRVIVLTGNHEAMNMTGDLRYVHPGEYRAFVTSSSQRVREAVYQSRRSEIEAATRARDPKLTPEQIRAAWIAQVPLGMIEHQRAWAPEGKLGRWTIGNPAVVRIGDTLFVHGGLSRDYAGMAIEEINRRVAAALSAQDSSESAIINDPRGPLWYRGLAVGSGSDERPVRSRFESAPISRSQELDQLLAAFKVRRIVIAHTPNLQGIIVDRGGKLIRIDTGISRSYGGVLSWLRIDGDRVSPHVIPRPPTSPRGGW